jgi:hypothetical protein
MAVELRALMTDATTAAKAIQERHWDGGQGPGRIGTHVCEGCGCKWPCHCHEDAGVVLARLNEAIIELEAALENAREAEAWHCEEHIEAALACLRG